MTLPLRAALAGLVLCTVARADDWPQWMGPNRDAVWKEDGILAKFPANGPKKLWTAEVFGGYSGPAVVGDKVYHFDYKRATGDATPSPAVPSQLTGEERLVCFDAASGKELWKYAYDCPYKVSYACGPRCTPTVAGGKIYLLGTMGNLTCLDETTGKPVWKKDFKTDYKAKVPIWGYSSHPLVTNGLVITMVGGEGQSVVAFDAATGKEAWKALSSNEPGYSCPSLIEAGGRTQLVVWTPKKLAGLDPKTGAVFWSLPLEPKYGMAIMAPRKDGDILFAGGVGMAALAVKLDANAPGAKELWRGHKNTGLYPVNMTPFLSDGVIYGVDQPGQLRAVKLDTGEHLWSTFEPVFNEKKEDTFGGGGSGTAFIVKNGTRYFLFNEKGTLIIANLSPGGYEQLDKADLIAPTGNAFGRKAVWSHPAYARGCIFVRNDSELSCFSLR